MDDGAVDGMAPSQHSRRIPDLEGEAKRFTVQSLHKNDRYRLIVKVRIKDWSRGVALESLL